MLAEPNVIVVQESTDWVSNLAVPFLAILVSSVIAIALAAGERRAADKSRRLQELANLQRTLALLNSAAFDGDAPAAARGINQFVADVNVLEVHLRRSERPVLAYVTTIVFAGRNNGMEALASATTFATQSLTQWNDGRLSVRDFEKNMPTETAWEDEQVDLSEYVKHTSPR